MTQNNPCICYSNFSSYDGFIESEPCIPWEIDYASASIHGEALLVEKCEQMNTGSCAIRACVIEGFFVIKIFQAFFDTESNHESGYLHSDGFDPDLNCPSAGNVDSEVECCGNYPLRHPFKTKNGENKCCGSKIYNEALFQCCPDETLSIIC